MAIEALDIVASVAAYLAVASLENIFASHRFEKATLTLTVILGALVALQPIMPPRQLS